MNQNNTSNKSTFSLIDSVVAWFCVIASYIFCRVFFLQFKSLGCFALVIIAFVFTMISLKIKGYKPKFIPTVCAIISMLISFGLIIYSNQFLNTLIFIFAMINYLYFVYSTTENNIKGMFSDYIFADLFKVLFVLPFCSFGDLFTACVYGKAKSFSKTIGKVILGIILAIIPTVIVFLLLSYDNNFTIIAKSIFAFDFYSVFITIVSLIFTLPISLYLFGLFSSAYSKKCSQTLSQEQCEKIANKAKFASVITIVSATLPLILIYIIFFISQFDYYVSGFSGVLPKDFSFAEYAREGFFQLCAVALINLIVISFVIMLTKTSNKTSKIILKFICIIFSVFTLVLIATAIAKMIMYIDSYGLTQKRVYATWAMIVIAMIFICVILKQFIGKFKLIAFAVAIFVVLFAGLCLSNVDTQIAKYNVNYYITNGFENADLETLYELGDASAEQLVRLSNEFDKIDVTLTKTKKDDRLKQNLNLKLTELAQEYKSEEIDLFCYNYTHHKAKTAVLQWYNQ